ncbi:MAG: hypothetical protein QMD65_01735 [Patescibacteria group bacterium]|nr:hypothetical protein [Patescibacteria group bacterium]
MKQASSDDYIKTLKERMRISKIYSAHQMIGLSIAELLEDGMHKALYMKLAKEYNNDWLMRLARDVASRANIQNKGAYFMKLLQNKRMNEKD